MKRIKTICMALILTLLLVALGSDPSLALDRANRQNALHTSVQIVALNFEGQNASAVWTGSGTIIDPGGLILTNYHVVEENGEWNKLGIGITTSSDQPPQPSFFAEIAAKAPRLDLAVLRIVTDLDGNEVDPVSLDLPYLQLGSADSLEVGDELNIFGYPGIGGATITFTQGEVSGFVNEEGVDYQRAWIKTDATIAGGNSGGTAVDEQGLLIGVPTKLGAGNTEYFADVRPIQDTNGDGIVDEKDTPIPLGGFMNSLRPINLAFPLIDAARKGESAEVEASPGHIGPGRSDSTPRGGQAAFGSITFATQQNADDSPKDPGSAFPTGTSQLLAYFDYENMSNGAEFNYAWTIDDVAAAGDILKWSDGSDGTFLLSLDNAGEALPEGKYELALGVAGELLQSGIVTIGQAPDSTSPAPPAEPQQPDDAGVTLYGQVVDADTGKPIPAAFILLTQPGVSVDAFYTEAGLQDGQTAAIGITDEKGNYVTFPPLVRGNTYGVIIVAENYQPIAVDNALEITADDPDPVELETVSLSKG